MCWKRRSSLVSKISAISYSISPSTSTGGGGYSVRLQVALGVNRQGWVVPLISKEGRRTSSLVWGIVVCKFREWKKCGPVFLLVVAVAAQVLFQGLVNPFRLAVTLRVVAGSGASCPTLFQDCRRSGTRTQNLYRKYNVMEHCA